MPKYVVTVRYEIEREIFVVAKDAGDAENKACEIVGGWNGVVGEPEAMQAVVMPQ